MAVIYGLCHPDTGELRYIGKANDPVKRLKGHMREGRRRTPLYDWISTLEKCPSLLIIHDCNKAAPGTIGTDWREMEKLSIYQARALGFRLLNLAEGGDEPFCSMEVRRANGPKAVAARTRTPKAEKLWRMKRMLGDNIKRGFVSEATKAKIRAAAMSHPHIFGQWANI